jgi:hypothetical protein
MKTTASTVLTSKIEKLTTAKKLTKNSIVYGWLQALVQGETTFRPVYTQGSSWKYSSLVDKTNELTSALSLLGVEFEQGNDAPRGGKTGAFIKIVTKVKL